MDRIGEQNSVFQSFGTKQATTHEVSRWHPNWKQNLKRSALLCCCYKLCNRNLAKWNWSVWHAAYSLVVVHEKDRATWMTHWSVRLIGVPYSTNTERNHTPGMPQTMAWRARPNAGHTDRLVEIGAFSSGWKPRVLCFGLAVESSLWWVGKGVGVIGVSK